MSKRVFMVGSGVVGQATGTVLAEKGFDVTFVDAKAAVVERLRQKGFNAYEVDSLENPNADFYLVNVPTYPLDLCKDAAEAERLEQAMTPLEWCEVGIDFMKSAANTLGKWVATGDRYCVIAVRSAVLPGTTEEMVIPAVEAVSRKKAGADFGVCVNPEYLREENSVEDERNPWVNVIGALDQRSGDTLEELYRWVKCPRFRISIREAEFQKFVHNLFNAAKISFFNEMRLVSEKIGVDHKKVIPIVVKSCEGLWSPEYGTKDKGPFGGSCLPKDSQAFLAWAKKGGMETRMMEAVVEVNHVFEQRMLGTPAGDGVRRP